MEENRLLRQENSSLISLCTNLEEQLQLQRQIIPSLRLELGEDPTSRTVQGTLMWAGFADNC